MLIAGGVATQALQLLFYPVITRLYSPPDFGDFLLYSGVIVIFVSLALLKLDAAILAGRTADLAVLRRMATLLMLAASVLAGGAVLIILGFSAEMGLSEGRRLILAFLPFGLGLQGVYAIAFSKTVREKRYRVLAFNQVAMSVVSIGIQILAGTGSAGLTGLLSADLVARFTGIVLLGLSLRYRGLTFARERLRYGGLWRRYRRYPTMLAPAAVLNVGSQQLQNILFPLLFGAAQGGQFALATRVLSAPIGLTSKAIGNVFTGEAASHKDDLVTLRGITLHVLGLTTACALPIAICVTCTAPMLFPWIFGQNWQDAGIYAAIMAAGLSASLVVSPLSNLITLRDSLHTALYFTGAEMVARALPFLVGGALGSGHLAVWLLSIGNVLLYGVGLIRFMHLAKLRIIDYVAHIKSVIFLSLISFAPLVLAVVLRSGVKTLIVSLLGGVVLYGIGIALIWKKWQAISA